jgi:hypothetical protein
MEDLWKAGYKQDDVLSALRQLPLVSAHASESGYELES